MLRNFNGDVLAARTWGELARESTNAMAWVMSTALRGLLIVVTLCVAVGAIYWFTVRDHPPPAPAPAPTAVTPPAAPPVVRAEPAGPPLPPLPQSDPELLQSLTALLGSSVEPFLLRPGIVHRIVATVDNLPRTRLPLQVLPIKSVGGEFLTARSADGISIRPDNADRYARYVSWATRMDAAQLVAIYRRDYPLFQQAYRELGYPSGEFNDRLIEAIDDLLEAPQPTGPIFLTVPRAMFEYVDTNLQDASAGQKVLIRLGADSETRVKAKLREIRRALDGVELPR